MQLIDKYKPIMAKLLTPQVTNRVKNDIARYVDKNSDTLLTLDLSKRYSFGDNDRKVLYDAISVTEDSVTADINNSKDIYSGNKVQSNPFYVVATLEASHYMNKKDQQTAEMIITYMSLMMVVSIHKGMFKYGVNQQIMDYTIANLDNTYLIRQFPSLFAFVQDNTHTCVETYKTRLMTCTDKDITWVVDAIWTRMKGKFKKIAQRYYENHKAGNYLNQDTETTPDSESYHEMDNLSFAIDRLTDKVYISLINRQYDKRYIKYSITSSDTSYQKVCNLIEDIIDGDGKDKRMREVISSMITFFLRQSGKPISYIAKGDFIAYMKVAYGSNTTVPQMETIKRHIEYWLDEHMFKYGRASYGKTAKIQYRRCLFMFFVFAINGEAKQT